MGKNDWAIVVGIDTYFDPNLPSLKGPANDAQAFYDWVTSPEGGAVPTSDDPKKKQAFLIQSSAFHPPFASLQNALPTPKEIEDTFHTLIDVADANAEEGGGLKIGDRLYLFFAGHGFEPHHPAESVALMTANATAQEVAHVLGTYLADWVYYAAFFNEVFLFMDCCRNPDKSVQPAMPYPDQRANDYYKVRRFYGFGARGAKEAIERDFNGKVHGVFTYTLLEGLRGAASDPDDPTIITAESLRGYLYSAFPKNLDAQQLANPNIPNEPEVRYEQKATKLRIVGKTGVFARVQQAIGLAKAPDFSVRITTQQHVGKTATIRDKAWEVVNTIVLAASTELRLARGLYAVEVPGASEQLFEVTGAGGTVDVTV
jgi:hypothetical protein